MFLEESCDVCDTAVMVAVQKSWTFKVNPDLKQMLVHCIIIPGGIVYISDVADVTKTANSIRARVLNPSLLQFVIEHFKSVSVLDFHVPYIKRDAQKMASFIC